MPVLTKINTNSIAEDAITGDKFAGDAYLANTATQNISGTYSESRLYTSDAYTLSGNVTINSDVVLSTVKHDDDVVLTADGARTITGTGVLSGGSLLVPQRNDLTGMTGELGSVVTGAPAITGLGTVTSGTLGSDVKFPAGHVLQIQTSHLRDVWSYTNTSEWNWGGPTTRADQTTGSIIDDLSIIVTAKGTNSDFYLSLYLDQVGNSDMDGGYNLAVNIYSSVDGYTTPVDRGNAAGSRARVTSGLWSRSGSAEFHNTSISTNLKQTGASIAKGEQISYRVACGSRYTTGGNTVWINKYNGDNDANYSMRSVSTFQVTEVAT